MNIDSKSSDLNVEFSCPVCSFDLWLPLARLKVSVLGLYDDARFPGRCILALNEHVEDFSLMDRRLACDFISDCQKAARAIKAAVHSDRVNVAILGNEIAHVHFHLVPRKSENEPIPTRPPWEHPVPKSPLLDKDRIRISSRIREELARV